MAEADQARPVLIVAATIADGQTAAAQAGIENFSILTPRSYAQVGRVIRGYILTPAFAELIAARSDAARSAMSAARIDARKSGIRV